MEKFIIEGGKVLNGRIRPGGSKNEVLPVLAATLLSDKTSVIQNIPRIADIFVLIKILEHLGAEVIWQNEHTLAVTPKGFNGSDLPLDLCRSLRASILLAGPLLARFGSVILPPPGGDVIGRRRLDTHFLGFSALGARVHFDEVFRVQAKKLVGADIFLDEPSVTGTENIIMAAVLAAGTTVIHNAACEPHVQGLCRMLLAMGARISGIGSNCLTIVGVTELGGCEHRIGSDYLEIGSYVGLAAMTQSELIIEDVQFADMRMIQMVMTKLGIAFELQGTTLTVKPHHELRMQADFLGQIPQIADGPWPMFPTDMMSIVITVATQAVGTVIFFEKMFDGRMFFVDSLVAMGAKIIMCDPHRVVVTGPAQLYGSTLESPDVRAGMALVLAALAAKGKSTIYNIRHIDRGYEKVETKLQRLGARIERLKE